jgi:hypothetical protein
MSDVDLTFGSRGAESVLQQQDKIAGSGRKLKEEFADLNRSAVAAFRGTLTQAERLELQIESLDRAMEKGQLGKLTAEQAAQALGRLRGKLADVEQGTDKAFGSTSVTMISQWAAGLAGPAAVLTSIADAMAKAHEQAQEIARMSESAIVSEGQLAQLAQNDPQFKAMLDESRAMFAAGAGESRDETANTVFSLHSAGVKSADDRLMYAEARSTGSVQDVAALARAAATIRANMGDEEVGTQRQQIAKAIIASELSPSKADELMTAAAGAGTAGKTLGLSDEQLLAGTATLATARGSASEGGTRLAAFLSAAEKAGGYAGKPLAEMVTSIDQREQGGENLRDILGDNKEALEGFRLLRQNFGSYQDSLGKISAANDRDVLSERLALIDSDPALSSARVGKRLKQGAQVTDEALLRGSYESLLEGLQADRASQAPFFGNWLNWMDQKQLDWGGMDARTIVGGAIGRGEVDPNSELARQYDQLERQTQLLEKTLEANRETNQTLKTLNGGGLRAGAG